MSRCTGCGAPSSHGNPAPSACSSCPPTVCPNCCGINRIATERSCACWVPLADMAMADIKALFAQDGTFSIDPIVSDYEAEEATVVSEYTPEAIDDRNALGEVIWAASYVDERSISVTGAYIVAKAILSSDWLAAHDAEVRAQAPVVTDEMVERAAIFLYEDGWHGLRSWSSAESPDHFRTRARAALEAAFRENGSSDS